MESCKICYHFLLMRFQQYITQSQLTKLESTIH